MFQKKSKDKKNKLPLKKRIISLLKNIVFFVVVFLLLQTWMQRNMVKGDAPTFDTTLINGDSVQLESFRGKPVIVHFWADWCPICKLEEGSITSFTTDSTQLVTVAFQSGDADNVKQFMKQQEIEAWSVIVDQEGSLSRKYGVTGVPATFFVDAQGKVRFKTIGLTSKWGMKFRLWLTGFY